MKKQSKVLAADLHMYRAGICQSGFTLIELIVALALLSIAFGVIYSFFLTNQKLINKEQNDIDLHFEMSNAATRLSDELKESRCLTTGAAIDGTQKEYTLDYTKTPLIFAGANSSTQSALYLRIVPGSAVGEADGAYLELKRITTDSAVTPLQVQQVTYKYLYVKTVKLTALPSGLDLGHCSGVDFELSGTAGILDKRTLTLPGSVYFRIQDAGS